MRTQQGKVSQKKQMGVGVSVPGLSAEEVKTRLKEQGLTVKEWARRNDYPYDTVSCVLRGINRGTYGIGHRIAVKLGLKREAV